MNLFLGIDPGQSGAYAVVDENGSPVGHVKGKDSCTDRAAFLREHVAVFGMLERVNAMPKQGVSSTFKFGTSFGEAIGILEALGIRHELITPSKWQQVMSCRTGGDKNVSKQAAQRLFPGLKVTHAIADAYLIAECARRRALELSYI